jgi:hypothetical protein
MLGQGRYCGTHPPTNIPETSGNELNVKFVGVSAAVSQCRDFHNVTKTNNSSHWCVQFDGVSGNKQPF